MNANTIDNWSSGNYRYLIASAAGVRLVLENFVARRQDESRSSEEAAIQAAIEVAETLLPKPSALQQLCREFKLSDFERNVLLLCVATELDPCFADLCAQAQESAALSYPTFNLAMSALSMPHWDAISPDSPLRYWQLIEVVRHRETLSSSQLQINERILHYLMGVDCLDAAFKGIIEPVSISSGKMVRSPSLSLTQSHFTLASQIAGIWTENRVRQSSNFAFDSLPITARPLPIVQLCGSEVASKTEIALAACELANLKLAAVSTAVIPTVTAELNELILLWQREAKLNQYALLLDCDEMELQDAAKENAIAQFIAKISSPLIIATLDRRRASRNPFITFDVNPPTKQEQLEIWQNALGKIAPILNGQVELLVEQFNLNAPTIYAVCDEAIGFTSEIVGTDFTDKLAPQETIKIDRSAAIQNRLWDTCRAQSRPQLDDLAQRILPAASWDDLVLPATAHNTLQEIAAHVRQRTKVYGQWGFASKGGRGLGISALFAGMSGTGKTMSAEVLATELQLDLYRIDLSSVVSKYIGETEKNLRRVFDAAEGGATILLFDEADAIFGKRSDVKDSHDRYANMEVSYLLQRMESYQGLAILTTNLKDSLDTAFLRRIRFVVKYAFPDTKERAEIWRRVFPKNTPTESLDFARLGRLNVAGGNIRNIALNAAFMAAEAGEAVMMKHLLTATKAEYIKLERTLTDEEIKGWV
ncbi:AAA ATPase central domain protein (plasmid) [Oscillatoria nigro-viridis PCC 7112]|uniref:AAA ATPase central domain protein n=1 Tax=Phormidium nigroviride PCC 7112 TaxID=179408 RepID=K9VUX5_9CYAN|nr:ATP-binding protein [Oscillatoria nigro-viridis]AFZ10980.1 AAA ATPase central domain protein [Oscillatoria nigro-viridis PCC 7112]